MRNLCAIIVLMVLASVAGANTWDGDSGTNNFWNNGDNWVEGSRPGFGGTATFVGDASTTPNPDLNGSGQVGRGLDFQTSGWTISDSAGGGYIRVDGGLPLNSQGTGVNHVQCNITGSGGQPAISVGPDSVLHISGSYGTGLGSPTGTGKVVFDNPGPDGRNSTSNLDADLTVLFNGVFNHYQMNATAGTIGGTGAVQGYRYQTSNIGGTATIAPGGDGTYGPEIGALTWQSEASSIRHILTLEDGASLDIQIGQSLGVNDQLRYNSYGSGRLNIQDGVTLNLYGSVIPDGDYTVVTNVADDMTDIAGTFSSVNYNGSPIDPENFIVTYNPDSIVVSVTGIPEPTSLIVIGLGGLLCITRQRR